MFSGWMREWFQRIILTAITCLLMMLFYPRYIFLSTIYWILFSTATMFGVFISFPLVLCLRSRPNICCFSPTIVIFYYVTFIQKKKKTLLSFTCLPDQKSARFPEFFESRAMLKVSNLYKKFSGKCEERLLHFMTLYEY